MIGTAKVIERRDAPARTARAAVFAAVAVVLLLALRAKSDGARPGIFVIVLSFVLLTVLARPWTSKEHRLPVIFSGLVATQLLLHVGYLFASTGQLTHSGSAGLVCSPATAPVGTACLPTERGGLLLLSAQLLAAAIFAAWVRGADSVIWRLARARFGALVAAVVRFGAALVSALIALVAVVRAAAFSLSPTENSAPRPRLSLFVRQCGRRGPPPRAASICRPAPRRRCHSQSSSERCGGRCRPSILRSVMSSIHVTGPKVPGKSSSFTTKSQGGAVRQLAPWASFFVRLVGALVFAIAGFAKIGDPAGTIRTVRAYRILPEAAVHPVAYGLPPFEIALAVLVLLGIATRVTGLVAVVTMSVFVAAIASAGIRGLRIDCGCFGGGGAVTRTHYLLEIGRDALLLLVLVAIPLSKRSRFSIDDHLRQSAGLRARGNNRKGRRQNRIAPAVAGMVVAVAALGGIVVNSAHPRTATALVAPAGSTPAGGIVVGDTSAAIKLIAYEDPQCPVCRQFEEVNGDSLQQAVKAGKVSVEYRMRSFLGPESVRADNALAAAQQQGKFEALREALFAHQPVERTGGFTTDDLLTLGRSVGLDNAAFRDAIRSMTYETWVVHVDDRASRDGNVGTPELIEDGQTLTPAQTFDPARFKAALGLT